MDNFSNFPWVAVFIILLTVVLLVVIAYTFYVRNKGNQVTVNVPINQQSLETTIQGSALDISNEREFLLLKAREFLGTDVSNITDEPHRTVVLDKFLDKLQKLTSCTLDPIKGEYKYGKERVKLLKGTIGEEVFVMMLRIDEQDKEYISKKAVNYDLIKGYCRSITTTSVNDEGDVVKTVDEILPVLTYVSVYCKTSSLHVKADRITEALEASKIIWKREPSIPNEATVYTLSYNGQNNQLSLSATKTSRFNYSYTDFNKNYENVPMNILGFETELTATECLDYAIAALGNSQNCMVVGKPGIGKTVFSTAIITQLSKMRDENDNSKYRIILLDANNISLLQTPEFANTMKQLANDKSDVINMFYMEDADALDKMSFNADGSKTPFGSFFLSFLSGTYQKMYNAVWLVSSNETIEHYNDIMRRRFQIVMPFSELSLEKAEEKAKEVSTKETKPEKNAFNWGIWGSIKERKTASGEKFTLADIYSCIQPNTAENKFAKIQKDILAKKLKVSAEDVIVVSATLPLEITNPDKVVIKEDIPVTPVVAEVKAEPLVTQTVPRAIEVKTVVAPTVPVKHVGKKKFRK